MTTVVVREKADKDLLLLGPLCIWATATNSEGGSSSQGIPPQTAPKEWLFDSPRANQIDD